MRKVPAGLGVAIAMAVSLSACVSQTTVENKLPDQIATGDVSYRARVQTELAAEYYRTANYAAAMNSARQALNVMPNYAPAHSMLALIYMELKQDDKAQQSFDMALKYSPDDSDVLNNYGWFVCQRQDPNRAMQYFQRALLNPLYATPGRALHNAGLCAKKGGDLAGAEAQFRAASLRQPQYAPPLYELAELNFARGNLKEAEILLGRYNNLVQAPSVEALYLGARIARLQGDKNSEESYLQQMRRRFPDAPQTRLLTEPR